MSADEVVSYDVLPRHLLCDFNILSTPLHSQDEDHTDGNVCACAGLLGDLCSTFGASLLPIIEAHGVALSELLTEGRRSKTSKTKTLATWATKEIKKLKANNQ